MPTPRLRLSACLLAAAGLFACHEYDFSARVKQGEIDIYDDLFAVSVADDDHAVAVGYHGAAYWTSDGGETWHKGETGTQRLLYSVSLADSKNGWAVGQSGTILHTSDGGRTWQSQPNVKAEEGSHLFGVHAIDASTAWAVGEWGTRIVTHDGGDTWEDRSLTIDVSHPMFVWLSPEDQGRVRRNEKVYEDVGLNNVTCLDAPSQRCWMIGEFGYIFHSTDRGETWQRSEIVGDVAIDPIPFAYNQIAIGDADEARLVEFASKIEDATHLNVLVDPFFTKKEFDSLAKKDDPFPVFDLLSARMDEVKGVLEGAGISSDRLRMPNKPPWDYEDFVEEDSTFLDRYFEGRRADAPMVRVSVIQNPYLFTVSFRDEEQGLISGLGGVILRSADGGKTWRYERIDRKQALFSVADLETRAVAVGEKGLIRESTDGGSAWAPPEPDSFPEVFTFMRDLGFEHNARLGFIVGQQGMVLRSRDSGRSWARVLPPGGDHGVGRML
ncbi:MAG TPA: YCF48-related protein [Myxococcota bacterium]|nr:YCF48-related protein [Myxococcota bacterium]